MQFPLNRASWTLKEPPLDGAFEKAVFSLKMAPKGLLLSQLPVFFEGLCLPMSTWVDLPSR
jgi:hypothetical protein